MRAAGPLTLRAIWTAAAAHHVFFASDTNAAAGLGSIFTFTGLRAGLGVGVGDGTTDGEAEAGGEAGADAMGTGRGDGEPMTATGWVAFGLKASLVRAPATFQVTRPMTRAATTNATKPRSLRIAGSPWIRGGGGGS